VRARARGLERIKVKGVFSTGVGDSKLTVSVTTVIGTLSVRLTLFEFVA
jgi:hypothetical protein